MVNFCRLVNRADAGYLSAPDLPTVNSGAIPWKGGISSMRSYELIVIIHPGLDEAAVNEALEKIKGWITAAGGTVDSVDTWGKRRLAYAIQKQSEGLYYLLNVQMDPAANSSLERNLRILEPVMRYSIIVKEE